MRNEYGISLPKDPRRGASRPRQLKDTCDMCSASKVKCDKRKPLCTRCERLEYPCFYSPARRLPKRRSSQPAPSGCQSEPSTQAISKGSSSEKTSSKPFNGISDKSPSLLERDELPRPALSIASIHPQSQGPQGANSLEMDSDMHHSPPRRNYRELDYFDGAVDIMNTFHRRPDSDHPTTTTADKPTIQAPQGIMQNDQHRRRSVCRTCQQVESPAFSASSDCAAAAASILQYISATHMPESPSHTCVPNNKTSNLDIDCQINILNAEDIKRVSFMLICSCSKKADVGLLVAAICIALLDRMGTILGSKIHLSQSPTDSTNSDGTEKSTRQNKRQFRNIIAKKSTDKDSERHELHRCNVQRGKSPETDNKDMMMQLVDELPRVSNLVAQFTQRYNQERDLITRGVMKTLISSMNCKLQMITDRVTSWVAQV